MSGFRSKIDFYRHLHVQLRQWLEKESHRLMPCTVKNTQAEIEKNLRSGLTICKRKGLVPTGYQGEVSYFFKLLKNTKFDKSFISKLKLKRERATSTQNILDRFSTLSETKKHLLPTKLMPEIITQMISYLQTWIGTIQSTPNITSVRDYSVGATANTTSMFNESTWLKEMYKLLLKASNNIDGRVNWGQVTNGTDPNNAPKSTADGEIKQSKGALLNRIKELLPGCIERNLIPYAYKDEVRHLEELLDTGQINRTEVEKHVGLRKLAVHINELLQGLGTTCDFLSLIDPTRRVDLVLKMEDLARILCLHQSVPTEANEHSGNEDSTEADMELDLPDFNSPLTDDEDSQISVAMEEQEGNRTLSPQDVGQTSTGCDSHHEENKDRLTEQEEDLLDFSSFPVDQPFNDQLQLSESSMSDGIAVDWYMATQGSMFSNDRPHQVPPSKNNQLLDDNEYSTTYIKEEHVLDVWSDVGDNIIATAKRSTLELIDKKLSEYKMAVRQRLDN